MPGDSERKTSSFLKRTQRKKEWLKKQRRATNKASRYSLPRNSLASQTNMVKYPQTSIGASLSASSFKNDLTNKLNNGLKERSLADIQSLEARAIDAATQSLDRNIQLNALIQKDTAATGQLVVQNLLNSNKDLRALLSSLSENERNAVAADMNRLLQEKAAANKAVSDLEQQLATEAGAADAARAAQLQAQLAQAKAAAAAAAAAVSATANAGLAAAAAIVNDIDAALATLSSALQAAHFNFDAVIDDLNAFKGKLFPGLPSEEYMYCTSCHGMNQYACAAERGQKKSLLVPTVIKACFEGHLRRFGLGIANNNGINKIWNNNNHALEICANVKRDIDSKNTGGCNNIVSDYDNLGEHIIAAYTTALIKCKKNNTP